MSSITKSLALILIGIIAISFVGLLTVKPVNAQTVTPTQHPPIIINPDGSVSPSTAPIQRTGSIYILTDNIVGSIEVKKNDTVIDGNGHTVKGWSNGFGGIELFLVRNVTLENFILNNLQSSIRLTYAENCIVINNTIQEGVSWLQHTASIYVEAGSSNIIAKNTLVNNVNATYFVSTTDNKIIANNIKGSSGVACLLYDSSNNTFYYNNFINNHLQVLDIREANYPFVVPQSIDTWDNGTVGNYWSDYTGQGSYVIDQNNVDSYPLTQQVDVSSISIGETPSTSSPSPSPTVLSSSSPIPTINTGQHTELFPTSTVLVVALVLLAVVIASVLLYRRSRKTKNQTA